MVTLETKTLFIINLEKQIYKNLQNRLNPVSASMYEVKDVYVSQ